MGAEACGESLELSTRGFLSGSLRVVAYAPLRVRPEA